MRVLVFYFVAVVLTVALAAEVQVPPVPPTATSTKTSDTAASTSTSADTTENETPTSTTEQAVTTVSVETTTLTDEQRCSEMIGKFVNGKFEGLEVKYDLAKLLEKYGGPPGRVNATRTEKEDAPVDEEDKDKRPLPDADQKYWIYTYGDTDTKTYIRIEHAVRRFSKTPKEFLEVRGELYFTPDDFCGKIRRALYTVDDRGFTFEVSREYCWIGSGLVSCAGPASCDTDDDGNIISCVAAPGSALLAALVGGGK